MNSRLSLILISCILTCIFLQGCATKRYGRMLEVTAIENKVYDCSEIEIEIAKVDAFILDVQKNVKMDVRAVAGILGDFGIGNSMEKNEALKSAYQRLAQLKEMRVEKGCTESSPTLSREELEAEKKRIEDLLNQKN